MAGCFVFVTACSEVAITAVVPSEVSRIPAPRFNYSGSGTECVGARYAGHGSPIVSNVPPGGWTAVAHLVDSEGVFSTFVQSCTFAVDGGPLDWSEFECTGDISRDWQAQCHQEQLPLLEPTTISSWQPMPAAHWEDGSGGGGYGVPSNPTPPDPFAACSSADESEDGWEGSDIAPPPDTSSGGPLVCRGAGALSCMQNNPGIYVGAWKIPLFGDRNLHHTAVAEVDPSRRGVTEVVGWWEHINNHVELDKQFPYFGGGEFSSYHWVKVSGLNVLTDFRTATLSVKRRYETALYTGSSNRFVSSVLKNSGITLTSEMRAKIGSAPGINWCF